MEETFSGVLLSLAFTKVSFPLPKDYFAEVQVSDEQIREYRELVRSRLDAVLADEKCCKERHTNGLPRLNPRDWKSVRSFDGLQVFRRRQRGRSMAELAAEEDLPQAMGAVANGQPSVMAMGSIPGTIEDMLYGIAGTTTEEARTTMSFLARKTDSAVLGNFELAAPDDPLHFLGIKWLYCSKGIGSARDFCYLQSMGVENDGCGKRYGYLVLQSVDVPEGQECRSSCSNELENDALSHEEAQVIGGNYDREEGVKQLPAVVEELLKNNDVIECRREKVEFTKHYLKTPAESSATMHSRTTIADFRGRVESVMSSCDEFMTRDRHCSVDCKEKREIMAAQFQALQSAADQIYGYVVAQRTKM
ncbi:hypothetical protein BBJ29_000945 [Phytophthora kernoviae]|uniref:Uncharacterized protein n=1 Tax=Phytophthora kernoviae TaxID=325452 RepID=A0A3R7JKH6_9STRA|nr:hypothetical protein BBJ29_000945 [Phytophthora kernoviae]